MTHSLPWRHRVALVVVLTAGSAVAAWWHAPRPRRAPAGDPAAPVVIALAGDAAMAVPLDLASPPLRAFASAVGAASVGIANFELSSPAPGGELDPSTPRWPAASPTAASDLRALGFRAVSLANNHTFDFGVQGLASVRDRLAAAGVAHAGAGDDLARARAPTLIDVPGGTVALVAATLSAAPGARATSRSGDINGRPGVHALRVLRRLTVDDAAFEGLSRAFPPSVLTANPDGVTWDLYGVTVARGDRGGMTLEIAAADLEALLVGVRAARTQATVVVVSLHAHEPGNRVDDVPDVLRAVAQAVVDAGADVVLGHGPHRLRAVEVHRGRPIFYSLGNVVFPDRDMRAEAADEFEDAHRNVLSPLGGDAPRALDLEGDVWWQSALAFVHVEQGRVTRVDLRPIDVGVGQDRATRGFPALARPPLASAILDRLRALSAPFGTTIGDDGRVVLVRTAPTPSPASSVPATPR